MAHKKTFTKYHGNGNDFIIFDNFTDALSLPWLIKHAHHLCHRHYGIGADGIIILNRREDAFLMTVINRDGTYAKNCGNGLRCAATHIFKSFGIDEVKIELGENYYFCQRVADRILVDMGHCHVTPQKDMFIKSCSQMAYVFIARVGNKHKIYFFKEPVVDLGAVVAELKASGQIDDDANIGFVFKDGRGIFSQVYERGVGFTNACGSGACAAASSLFYALPDSCNEEIVIRQPGGELTIMITKESIVNETARFRVRQMGYAEEVFMGICEVGDCC